MRVMASMIPMSQTPCLAPAIGLHRRRLMTADQEDRRQ